MVRLVSNPPNPWASSHVEWLEEPPEAQLEVHEEHAKSILAENDSPDVGFRWSLNPYRGCFHACAYCLSGDTRILMADGRTCALGDIHVGDVVFGTIDCGDGVRDLVRTRVSAHWSTEKPGVLLSLANGTQLVASADHRLLTAAGWVHVGQLVPGESCLVGPIGARPALVVRSVEPLGITLPMFDITTGTGDFIANGVVSHNCYARPSHQWLGFGAGTDFERKIVVKTNAPDLLRAQFMKPSWKGELIAFSGDTDCYQPLEASYALTRRCLEICAEFRNPVGLITKSAVIRRDVDVLARLAREARLRVTLSIPFAHDDVARKIEPGASSPARRFDTLRILSDAGISTGVAIAPIIPGLNDPDIPEILERAYEAGARSAFMILVRLPGEVLPVFRERINNELPPERVRKIEHAIEELRGGDGSMNDSRFGSRFRGQGERWRAIESLFELHRRRLGYDKGNERDHWDEDPVTTFRRPTNQLGLF
jgi:DNA repair photolyase